MVCAVVFLCGSQAFGDGKYIGRLASLARDPSMPSQAAVIGYDQGVETLIVESGVENDGSTLAWVVPVPAEPKLISAVSPGTVLSALDLSTPPLVEANRVRREMGSWAILVAIAIPIGLLLRFVRSRGVLNAVLVILLLGCMIGMFLPALANSRGMPETAGISVVRSVTAGKYEVDVLRAASADELGAWLGERGFGFSEEVRAAASSLIKDGWLFCAATVAPGKGLVAPHPLKVVFPTERIVYPMRLTAAEGGLLDLDLVVFAESPVTCDALTTWLAVPYDIANAGDGPLEWQPYRHVIGHPELVPLATSPSWMTRLHGRLDLSKTSADLELSPTELRSVRARLATWADLGRALVIAALAGLTVAMISVVPFVGEPNRVDSKILRPVGRERWGFAIVFGCLSLLFAVVIGQSQLKGLVLADVSPVDPPTRSAREDAWEQVSWAVAERRSAEEIRSVLRDALAWVDADGRRISREGMDVPFGWKVEELSPDPTQPHGVTDAIRVTIHDRAARPFEMTALFVWRPASPVREPERPLASPLESPSPPDLPPN
jgi:hypothetical protein